MPTAKIRAITTAVRPSVGMPGYAEVIEGGIPVLVFWAWDVSAYFPDGDGTKVVFRGKDNWFYTIDSPVSEVHSAISRTQAVWAADVQSRAAAASRVA